MPTTLYGEHIVRKSIRNCCSHVAEIARFHILRCCLGALSVQLFLRCRNCTISYIHHAGSTQISPDQRRPWNPISCSHAAEIARFHIFTMQVQPRSCQINPDQARSAQIKPDHCRSSQIWPDQRRSGQISLDQARSLQIRPDLARSAHHIVSKATCMKFQWKCTRYANLVVRFSQAWNPISQSISCSFLQMLFPRCRNCTISHIALLPWSPITSVVPTLQKL